MFDLSIIQPAASMYLYHLYLYHLQIKPRAKLHNGELDKPKPTQRLEILVHSFVQHNFVLA